VSNISNTVRATGLLLMLMPLLVQGAETRRSTLDYSSSQRSAADHAQDWNLSSSEWGRYQSLMQGPRGLWSPDLDPLYVLGIYAETVADRRRFAELVVQQEFERIEKELAFQREVTAAWTRMYGNVPMIDPAKMGLGVEKRQRPPSGTAAGTKTTFLFVSAAGCAGCSGTVERWVRQVRRPPELTLRIYVTGANTRAQQAQWISDQGLNELVRAGRVVVLPESGVLTKVMAGKPLPSLPYTIIR